MNGGRSTSEAARWRRLTGRDAPTPDPVVLRAGPVTALLDGPDLRHVRIGGAELVQRVYVAVRDAPWNTIPATYDEWDIRAGADRFEVLFHATHRHGSIHFEWEGRIHGTPEGLIRYTMDGACHGSFEYSKIGFNVHHDLRGAIGRSYRAQAGGREWRGVLPEAIDPQRIVDGTLSGMFDPYEEIAIEVVDGLEAVVRLDGDLLELQDHRNWTDANFKSYATPLALGFPFTSEDGQRIRQELTIGARGVPPPPDERPATLRVGDPSPFRMPAVGLGVAGHGQPMTAHEVEVLRRLAPDHLRVDVSLADGAWEDALGRALEEARSLATSVELAIFANETSSEQLAALAAHLRGTDVAIARVLVYPLAEGFSAFVTSTPGPIVVLVRDALRPAVGDVVFAGGTNQNFSDINRDRPTEPAMDGLCFSISPTVHAADDASMVENLAGQSAVVRFAREIGGPRSIHISPVTIATRFGPYPAGPPEPGGLPPAVDVRQASLLGAAWTVGSLGECARAGADSITFYETTGWQGVMERDAGAPIPDRFPSTPGHVFPLYHVLADALEVGAAQVLDVESSDPLAFVGMAVATEPGILVLVANVTGREQDISVTGISAGPMTARVLDEESVERACADPDAFGDDAGATVPVVDGRVTLHLSPYAIVRLQGAG